MAYYLYRELTQLVIFTVGKSLRRCHNNALAGMDTQRIKVLHITDSNTVVKTVSYNFILNLFPSFERLFNKYLARI